MFCESQQPYFHFTMNDLIALPQKGAVTSCYNLGCGLRKPRPMSLCQRIIHTTSVSWISHPDGCGCNTMKKPAPVPSDR